MNVIAQRNIFQGVGRITQMSKKITLTLVQLMENLNP